MNHHNHAILQQSDLFGGIDTSSLSEMLTCLSPRELHYQKNECAVHEGDPFTALGIVTKGRLAVIKNRIDGTKVIITILEPGDIFGEMLAFSGQDFWPNSICAEEDSSVTFISPERVITTCANACTAHRQLINNFLTILSQKALHLNRMVEYLSIRRMRGRIAAYLCDHSKLSGYNTFQIPLNRNELAGFLNVSRPSLSREMARMKEDGLIDFHKSSFKILNPKGLREAID